MGPELIKLKGCMGDSMGKKLVQVNKLKVQSVLDSQLEEGNMANPI